jgi:hypothetical protein
MNFSLQHSTTYLCLLLIGLLSFSACQKEEYSIATITSFSVTQSADELIFTFTSSSQDIIYYEIDYYSPNTNDRGDFATNESSTVTKTIAELSLRTGELYIFNIRAITNHTNNGNVISGADPVSLNIGDFCGAPTSLSFAPASGFNWYNNNSISTSYYEISYGITGTLAADGEKITTNNTSNKEMVLEQGQVYDFYVRSYCNNALGWSNWEGPLTEYISQSLNVCIPPANLAFTVVRNSLSQAVGARCTWDDNGGNSNYEVNMVGNGSSATAGNIETATSQQITYSPMTQNTEYDFYVRSICSDGTPTSWVGPLNVNIGQ